MVQSGRTTVSNTSHVCVQGNAEFNWYDNDFPGFSDHSSWVYTYAQTPGCGPELVVPVGWIASKVRLFKYAAPNWALCEESDWAYGGGGDTHDGDITFEQAAVASKMWQGAPPPCGPGWYGTMGSCFVYTGSAWEGNSLWSGSQNVAPHALTADSVDQAPPPPWVQEDNTVNTDAATIIVPVVGLEGHVMTVGADGPPRMVPIWIGEVPPTPVGG
jgi:hypothetical protein